MDEVAAVRAYYDALDAHDYESLRSALAPGFVQHRPDRTFEGRTAFVAFMRDGRPQRETTHEVASVYRDEDDGVAVEGAVRTDDGVLVSFVDVFEFQDGEIVELRTYTR